MEIRALRKHEKEELIDLKSKVFSTYFDKARFFKAMTEEDPYYIDELSRVAVVNGRIVSNVRIVSREMNVRGVLVPMAGIADVCTHPDYRGRGLATSLLRDAIRYMERHGFLVSMLFTGIQGFYRRLGWEVAVPRYNVRISVDGLRDGLERFKMAGDAWTAEVFSEDHLNQVMEVYSEENIERTGTVARSREYWVRFIFRRIRRLGRELPGGFLVALKDGRVDAYVFLNSSLRIVEAGARRGCEAAYISLLRRIVELAEWKGAREIDAFLPPDHGLARLIAYMNGTLSVQPSGIMVKVVDGGRLIEKLLPALERRSTGLSGSVEIRGEGFRVTVSAGDGLSLGGEAEDYVEMDNLRLAQLVMGYRSVLEMAALGEVRYSSARAIEFIDRIMPAEWGHIWPVDSF